MRLMIVRLYDDDGSTEMAVPLTRDTCCILLECAKTASAVMELMPKTIDAVRLSFEAMVTGRAVSIWDEPFSDHLSADALNDLDAAMCNNNVVFLDVAGGFFDTSKEDLRYVEVRAYNGALALWVCFDSDGDVYYETTCDIPHEELARGLR